MEHIRGQDHRANVSDSFDLNKLIGEERLNRYYRYDGSLTTPPCFESVIWTVAIDPLKISLPQLHAFRYLHDHQAKLIQNTYRSVKKLGTRILFRSFVSKDIDEDLQERKSKMNNHGEQLNINMKFLISSLILFLIKF